MPGPAGRARSLSPLAGARARPSAEGGVCRTEPGRRPPSKPRLLGLDCGFLLPPVISIVGSVHALLSV